MTPEQMRDASLLELFSLEAEAQTQVLSSGLLALLIVVVFLVIWLKP